MWSSLLLLNNLQTIFSRLKIDVSSAPVKSLERVCLLLFQLLFCRIPSRTTTPPAVPTVPPRCLPHHRAPVCVIRAWCRSASQPGSVPTITTNTMSTRSFTTICIMFLWLCEALRIRQRGRGESRIWEEGVGTRVVEDKWLMQKTDWCEGQEYMRLIRVRSGKTSGTRSSFDFFHFCSYYGFCKWRVGIPATNPSLKLPQSLWQPSALYSSSQRSQVINPASEMDNFFCRTSEKCSPVTLSLFISYITLITMQSIQSLSFKSQFIIRES